jgi:hypothetical protein
MPAADPMQKQNCANPDRTRASASMSPAEETVPKIAEGAATFSIIVIQRPGTAERQIVRSFPTLQDALAALKENETPGSARIEIFIRANEPTAWRQAVESALGEPLQHAAA